MSESVSLLLPALLGLVLAAVCGCLWLLLRKPAVAQVDHSEVAVLRERLVAREQEIERLQQALGSLQAATKQEHDTVIALREKLSRQDALLDEERNQSAEKIRLLQQAREQMTLEFRNLANDILEQKGKTFSEASRQQLQDILKPLGEKIHAFEKKVEDTYGKEAQQRFTLEKEIRALHETNVQMSQRADNLAKALKGESKTQGIWGEVILERVLEKSGLQKGREYSIQVALKDADGRLRQPDVIVHLPEGKDVIIDSKVALTAYESYFSAADDDGRAVFLKQHIQSIRNHIKGLSAKNYQHLDGVRTLDYVLLFLPVEAAFTLAIQEDDALFNEAFEQNIFLVGPSTLLASLRTIRNNWRYEYQNKNAIEIAVQAGKLYDKFVAFTQDIEKIGERLAQTQQAYDAAHNKLRSGRGNVITHVEKLKKLGARASKQLPGVSDEADDGDEDA
ncbi:MAG: DNA recombination protein RmuC, partial [Pseudomonadota bacterium]|nr:DNA recombination protein RmuC [Pseudomonadota bacterium]